MAVLGLGLGATMQNLVLAVQNNVAQSDMGAASSVVAFFRSMGGSIGVSALGALLSHQVADERRRRASPGSASRSGAHEQGSIPDLATLPAPVRAVFEHAFGEATGHMFLVAVPFAVLALVCVLFIREVPLRTTILREDEMAPEAAARAAAAMVTAMPRAETARRCLEQEVGVLIRRVRRVIGERARLVHPDLQPASYLLLSLPGRDGARCGRRRSRTASASTRARSAGRSSTSSSSGCSSGRPTRPTAGRPCSRRPRTR